MIATQDKLQVLELLDRVLLVAGLHRPLTMKQVVVVVEQVLWVSPQLEVGLLVQL